MRSWWIRSDGGRMSLETRDVAVPKPAARAYMESDAQVGKVVVGTS